MKAPIAIIIYNRPDHVTKLIERLKPECDRVLFVISDGARANKSGEVEKVDACRNMFKNWPGKIHRNFADNNMGCRARVSTGLDWVFLHAEHAIVLEDDCIPSTTFFQFCDELLEIYSEDQRVMTISGSNHSPEDLIVGPESYYFASYHHCWGWATWARAWRHYDDGFSCWKDIRHTSLLRDMLGSFRASMYWHRIFDRVQAGHIDSWAYRWQLCCWLQSGYSIIPKFNLVTNEGTGDDALHTQRHDYAHAKIRDIDFPLSHPTYCVSAAKHDRYIEDHIFSKSLLNRVKWLAKKCFPSCSFQKKK